MGECSTLFQNLSLGLFQSNFGQELRRLKPAGKLVSRYYTHIYWHRLKQPPHPPPPSSPPYIPTSYLTYKQPFLLHIPLHSLYSNPYFSSSLLFLICKSSLGHSPTLSLPVTRPLILHICLQALQDLILCHSLYSLPPCPITPPTLHTHLDSYTHHPPTHSPPLPTPKEYTLYMFSGMVLNPSSYLCYSPETRPNLHPLDTIWVSTNFPPIQAKVPIHFPLSKANPPPPQSNFANQNFTLPFVYAYINIYIIYTIVTYIYTVCYIQHLYKIQAATPSPHSTSSIHTKTKGKASPPLSPAPKLSQYLIPLKKSKIPFHPSSLILAPSPHQIHIRKYLVFVKTLTYFQN